MEAILRSLGYSDAVRETFAREGVTVEVVPQLNPKQLDELGVTGIGRQCVLKGRCRQELQRRDAPGPSRQEVARETSRLFQPYQANWRRKKPKSVQANLNFMCLADRFAQRIPTTKEQQNLRECGLGFKKVSIASNATPQEVLDLLQTAFPKLHQSGGFEYLKADSSKRLYAIPLPEGGYTGQNLKGYGIQGKIYLRPIQADLDKEKSQVDHQSDDEILQECRSCHQMIPQTRLRKHILHCGYNESDEVLEVSSNCPIISDEVLEVDPLREAANGDGDTRPAVRSNHQQLQAASTTAATSSDDVLRAEPRSTASAPSDGSTGRSGVHRDGNTTQLGSGQQSGASATAATRRYITDYMDIIEPDSADLSDEELQFVMQESLNDLDRESDTTACEARLQEKLGVFCEVREEDGVDLIIRRKRVVKDASSSIADPGFSFYRTPIIHFAGENAIDMGGPKREFFALLMKELPSLGIVEGKLGKLYFAHDISLMEKGCYRLAGQMVAWSVLHGGQGFPAIHPALFSLMTGGSPSPEGFQIEDITDFDVASNLNMINSINTSEDIAGVVATVGDWAANNGCNNIYSMTADQTKDVVKQLLRQHMYYRCTSEIQQFQMGLDSVNGLWKSVMSDPPAYRPLFTSCNSQLTFSTMKRLFRYDRSPAGHRSYEGEEDTIYCWEAFLQSCEANSTETDEQGPLGLKEVLQFCTGADAIPPMGFAKQIDIGFFPIKEGTKPFPRVHTCNLELHLPRGMDEKKDFTNLMVESIKCSPGFGKI